MPGDLTDGEQVRHPLGETVQSVQTVGLVEAQLERHEVELERHLMPARGTEPEPVDDVRLGQVVAVEAHQRHDPVEGVLEGGHA